MREVLVVVGLVGVLGSGLASGAHAATADEVALADKFAPVVRLVEHTEECGPGEPYQPSDIDALMDEDTVALRGAWTPNDLVKIGPTADDLSRGLYEYHLDFPGNPLDPGCDYERWADGVVGDTKPTVYAHVVTQADRPGLVALQYWFFYPFNDYNNKHEGDWEMVQLVFRATDAAQALDRTPLQIGYSQHEGGELAAWDDDKLERVDGTHPVVHPAAGSHANNYDAALFLGRSAEQGVGCDDTRSPAAEIRPEVALIPSDEAAARTEFPWLGYLGRWGEQQASFYNGPTGPNQKLQWTNPITWAEEKGRDQSYALPAGGLLGTGATDFFCTGVAAGSDTVRKLANDPLPILVVGGLLVVLLVYLLRRTRWRPAAPLRAARRRTWGQTISASWRLYASRPRLFIGIGLPVILVTVVAAVTETILVTAPLGVVPEGGEGGGVRLALASGLGLVITGLGIVFVQAAAILALADIDAGREPSAVDAYRLTRASARPLVGAGAIVGAVAAALSLTVVLAPLAVLFVIVWALFVPAVVLERRSGMGALRRSRRLVRRVPWKVASVIVATGVITLIAGPVLGTLLILATDAPLAFANVVAGAAYALLVPFTALTIAYLYFDAVVRERLEVTDESPEVLPAEI